MKKLFFLKMALEVLIVGIGFVAVVGAWIGGTMGLVFGADAGWFGFKLFTLFFSLPAIVGTVFVKVKMDTL